MNPLPLQKARYVEYSQYFHLNSLQTTKRTSNYTLKMGIFHCYVVYQRVSVRKHRLFITSKNHPPRPLPLRLWTVLLWEFGLLTWPCMVRRFISRRLGLRHPEMWVQPTLVMVGDSGQGLMGLANARFCPWVGPIGLPVLSGK